MRILPIRLPHYPENSGRLMRIGNNVHEYNEHSGELNYAFILP
jgi:hypothetical protein